MPVGEGIKVEGALETAVLLRELPARVEKKGLKAAVSAATTPIARAAKAKAPRVYTGLLKKAIGKKTKVGRKKGIVIGLVGARSGIQGTYRGKKWVPSNYSHLVELGTQAHAIPIVKSGGIAPAGTVVHHPGTKPRPYLKPAYQEQKGAAERAAADKLKQVVESEAKKLGKL